MSPTTIPDAIIERIADDCVRIEQSTGFGQTALVDLHVTQVQLIAEGFGLLKGGPDLQRQVTALARKVRWLAQSIDDIRGHLPDDMFERCGDAFAFFSWLQMLERATALITEGVADISPTETATSPCPASSTQPEQLSMPLR